MYVLMLLLLLSGDEMTYAPGGNTATFKTKAACEKVLAEQKPKLAKELAGVGPFALECRKA